jgi:cell pole-organizing protein PopZ
MDAPAGAERARAPAPDDVLELSEEMETRSPAFRKIDGQPDVVFDEPAHAPEAPSPAKPARPAAGAPEPSSPGRTSSAGLPSHEPRHRLRGDESPLLSAASSAAIDSAFNALAHTVLVQNSRTLDELVREMLRPMLKAWLDDNLPHMVERLVRAEIERVSRGR